jgi:hypothetical protein
MAVTERRLVEVVERWLDLANSGKPLLRRG